MTPRVLIADDHPLTREALAGLLSANGFDVIAQASGGHEAVRLALELLPELIVLDLTMPDGDGLSALPQLREALPETAVIILTASEDDDNLLTAIGLGASGYLLKSETPERIVGFLKGASRGEAALSGAVARRLLEQVRTGVHKQGIVPRAIADRVSARELEVLLLLDEHLSTEEIAERLFISEHTVRSHVKSLLGKLKVSSRREALDRLASARNR